MSNVPLSFFTLTSAYSLAGVLSVGVLSYTSSKILLFKNAKWQDRWTFMWIVRYVFVFHPCEVFYLMRSSLITHTGIRRDDSPRIRRVFSLPLDVWAPGQHKHRAVRCHVCVFQKLTLFAGHIESHTKPSMLRERICCS